MNAVRCNSINKVHNFFIRNTENAKEEIFVWKVHWPTLISNGFLLFVSVIFTFIKSAFFPRPTIDSH